ncbi:MAG: DUF3833 family protein [Rhodanobacter sp.]
MSPRLTRSRLISAFGFPAAADTRDILCSVLRTRAARVGSFSDVGVVTVLVDLISKPGRLHGDIATTRLAIDIPKPGMGRHKAFDVMKRLPWILPFMLAIVIVGCPAFAATPRDFTPQNGFGGVSEGNGTLKLFFGKPRPYHVISRGTEQGDGTFRLEQTVTFQGKPSRDRVWMLVTTSPGHYAGTLSDAPGRVKGVTSGSHLSLHYRVKGPLVMHQELELMPDGRTIDNAGVITFIGIPVGHLRETITREGSGSASNDSFQPTTPPGAASVHP